MGITDAELLEKLKEKQRKMQELYEQRTSIGKAFEIPREGRPAVKVLLNYPSEPSEKPYPVYLNMHGGGFVEGDALTMDSFCQKLADRLGILVVNVNYILFPKEKYPYQIEEVESIRKYILEHGDELQADVTRIGLGGFSAGATLALGAVIKSIKEKSEGYRCCMCGYPMTSALAQDQDQESAYPAGDAEMLRAVKMFVDGEEKNPQVSVKFAEDEIVKAMEGVIIFYCGKDSLGKQGKEFAERLVRCGVPVLVKEYKEAYHGFIEVNRPDYFLDDPRKSEEQAIYTKDAEEFVIAGLSYMLCRN